MRSSVFCSRLVTIAYSHIRMDDFDEIPEAAPVSIVHESTSFIPEVEPEDALAAFNAAWKVKLEEKRLQELEAEKTARAKASEEISTLNTQRTIKLNAKKESNRNEEQVFVESIESDLASANIWDRVTKLIDANAGESADSTTDVGRMRKLFIQLKNEPLPSRA